MKSLYIRLAVAVFAALFFTALFVPFVNDIFASSDDAPFSEQELAQLESALIEHLQTAANDDSALAEIEQRFDIDLYLEPLEEDDLQALAEGTDIEFESVELGPDSMAQAYELSGLIMADLELEAQWFMPLYLAEEGSKAAEPQWLAHIHAGSSSAASFWIYELMYVVVGGIFVCLAIFAILRSWARPLQTLRNELAPFNPSLGGSETQSIVGGLSQDAKALMNAHTQLLAEQQARITPYQDLLHAIAHEFRSPMARLTFGLEMLHEAKNGPEYAELQHDMALALADMDDLVKEVLNYVRLRDGQMDLSFSELEVIPMVRSLIAKQSNLTPNIDFVQRGQALTVRAVQHLLERALINLVRNAARFADTKVLIAWQAVDGGVEISVEDDGIGVPVGKRERIFEPFTRLDASRSRDSGGVGLGLSIVDTICQQHHGYVHVEDSELGGARFVMFLPD